MILGRAAPHAQIVILHTALDRAEALGRLLRAEGHRVDIVGNFIVNNATGDAGGGIALDDSARVFIINNTVAHNDSTATGPDAFGWPYFVNDPPGRYIPPGAGGGGLNVSVPQPAGIYSRAHSSGLQAAFGAGYGQDFSDPVLQDNIIVGNRSFYWDATANDGSGAILPDPATPIFWDLAVVGTSEIRLFHPTHCLLTTVDITFPDGGTSTYDASNLAADPLFVSPYFNVYQAGAVNEGAGNMVTVTFLPTGVRGDYRIGAGSPAVDRGAGTFLGSYPILATDRDGQARPLGAGVDAGADERQ